MARLTAALVDYGMISILIFVDCSLLVLVSLMMIVIVDVWRLCYMKWRAWMNLKWLSEFLRFTSRVLNRVEVWKSHKKILDKSLEQAYKQKAIK